MWQWSERAPEGELFEDAYGLEGNVRYSCYACYGTGQDYGETCVMCGGFGWCVENVSDED